MTLRFAFLVTLVSYLAGCGPEAVSELETKSSIDKAVVAGGDLEPGEECYACNHVGDPDEEQWRAAKESLLEACIIYQTARCEFREECGNTSSAEFQFICPPTEDSFVFSAGARESDSELRNERSPVAYCATRTSIVAYESECDTRPIRWLKEFEDLYRCGADNDLVCELRGENEAGLMYSPNAEDSCYDSLTAELGFRRGSYNWLAADFACTDP